jgi:hypothetical protein
MSLSGAGRLLVLADQRKLVEWAQAECDQAAASAGEAMATSLRVGEQVAQNTQAAFSLLREPGAGPLDAEAEDFWQGEIGGWRKTVLTATT